MLVPVIYVNTFKDKDNFSCFMGSSNPFTILDNVVYGLKRGHKIRIRMRLQTK